MATKEQWQEMRKEYETTGFSLRELAQKYGIGINAHPLHEVSLSVEPGW